MNLKPLLLIAAVLISGGAWAKTETLSGTWVFTNATGPVPATCTLKLVDTASSRSIQIYNVDDDDIYHDDQYVLISDPHWNLTGIKRAPVTFTSRSGKDMTIGIQSKYITKDSVKLFTFRNVQTSDLIYFIAQHNAYTVAVDGVHTTWKVNATLSDVDFQNYKQCLGL